VLPLKAPRQKAKGKGQKAKMNAGEAFHTFAF